MNTSSIRQKLHNYLEVANDKKVKAIYAIMEEDIEESITNFTAEEKQELDRRRADYEKDKTQVVSMEESRKRVRKLIKKAAKK